MSLSDIAVFKARYGAVTFETAPFDHPGVLERDDIAAAIVEPLVQAAAGMRLVDRESYDPLRTMRPLLIVDEIATGFGRTGTMFAFEQLGLAPDLLCVGKGVTGGTLALSATLARAKIYDAFLGADEERVQFFHGHSYAGNPIACAAALASLDLFETEDALANAAWLATVADERLSHLQNDPRIERTRQAGLMIGIDLRDKQGGRRVAEALYERGHFTRAIGETIQLVPPLASHARDLHAFFDALEAAL